MIPEQIVKVRRGSRNSGHGPKTEAAGWCDSECMAMLVQQIRENFVNANAEVHIIPADELSSVELTGNKDSYWYWFYTKAFEEATGESFDSLNGYQRASVLIVLGYD